MPPLTSHILVLAVTLLTVILSVYSWKRRDVPGAITFAALIAACMEWVIASAFSVSSPDLDTKILWVQISYLGGATSALAWMIFSIQYTGQAKWLNRRRILALSVIPFVTILLIFTNPSHHLMWTRVWFDQYVRVTHGSWYWVFISYSYILSFYGLWRLFTFFRRSTQPYRSQALAVILGGFIILVWDILYISHAAFTLNPEISFGVVLLSTLIFGWGLFRYRLLDIVPIARSAVIESMSDGMVILDDLDRIIDVNPAAQKIFLQPNSNWIGSPFQEALPAWGIYRVQANQKENFQAEFTHPRDGQAMQYEMRVSPLKDRGGKARGRLVLLADIQERKRTEMAERDQRALAEALIDTASALNSTLQLDELLDRILTNVGRVVHSDAVNIMLINDGLAHIVRHQGYSDRGLDATMSSFRLKVKDIRNLREMGESGQPVLIGNVKAYSGWYDLPETSWICSYVGVPICIRGETVGFINLDSAMPDYFIPAHGDRLQAFADQAAVALENARLYEEVRQLAVTDSLTGLANRRALEDLGQREVEISLRFKRPLSAIMIDIDDFKQVNDTYGHLIGDQALLNLVKTLRENVRNIDLIGRYGGDEFLILLLETDLTMAYPIAERLRRTVSQAILPTEKGPVAITISLGVAQVEPGVEDLATLISYADQAMYEAKENGRNQASSWAQLYNSESLTD